MEISRTKEQKRSRHEGYNKHGEVMDVVDFLNTEDDERVTTAKGAKGHDL